MIDRLLVVSRNNRLQMSARTLGAAMIATKTVEQHPSWSLVRGTGKTERILKQNPEHGFKFKAPQRAMLPSIEAAPTIKPGTEVRTALGLGEVVSCGGEHVTVELWGSGIELLPKALWQKAFDAAGEQRKFLVSRVSPVRRGETLGMSRKAWEAVICG